MRVEWRPRATEDARIVWRFIALDSVAHADRWLDTLLDKVDLLIDNPRLGPPVSGGSDGLRSLKHGGYRLFYRISDERIDLLRVIHTARDLSGIDFD